MNNLEKLIITGITAFGPRWQTDIAAALGVSDRTVRNWLSKKYLIPSSVSEDLIAILLQRRDEIDGALKELVQGSENIKAILDTPGVISKERAYCRAHLIAQGRQKNDGSDDYDKLYETAFNELMEEIKISGYPIKK